ncbi:RNase A-like domain-containing protein [Streptomyces sp. AC555_RSS877]|uniref:RNase A-like domain-containing protein n=1 Tax=Streptomyces sp. AC555_RSS877 TaxID=2823688 RepID=UPI001C25852A|nr:RNase A-like domain-containing protein [Streptomyces sp. AC555_RSS877]
MADRPSDAERKEERDRLNPAAPDSGGGFDVQPPHLYYSAVVIRDGQFDYDKGATKLVGALNQYSQSAGTGWGPDSFAKVYMQIAEKFVQVWAASVVSVGGVAVGLTTTANNYQAADWSTRGMQGPAPRRSPPVVIDKQPNYGKINDIKWTGTGEDADSWAISGAMGEIPDFLADVIRPAIEQGLNLGKTHEITPGARDDDLKGMATAWRDAASTALEAGDNFTSAISYMTDPSGNNEWQSAMKSFCQSVWGTTAWGRSRNSQGQITPPHQGGRSWKTSGNVAPAQRRPILEVLHHTADTIQKTCDDLAQAAQTCRETTTALAKTAAQKMVEDLTVGLDALELLKLAGSAMFGQLVLTFRKHMDRAAADRAVEIYQQKFSDAATTLLALEWELDEALRSAPTFIAQEARAEAFAGRSLNEFKKEHKILNGENPFPYMYTMDLAMAEDLGGGHTIDKHVGKTDAQLLQRLRDQSGIPAASSFTDLASAQKYTQACIRQNTGAINAWLATGPPPQPASPIFQVSSVGTDPNNPLAAAPVTGRTSRMVNGQATPVTEAHGVATRLRYDNSLTPPFVVVTSMPK